MNFTNILLALILLILVKQFYPEAVNPILTVAIAAAAIYGSYWLVAQAPQLWRKRRVERLKEQQDEQEFWEYEAKSEEIRSKYDPERKWNEATNVPREYLAELRQLNLQHRGMLQRRNGWTADDFDE